jgi:hypothetical protein
MTKNELKAECKSSKLKPVILATWVAKIRRIKVQEQSRQIVCETPISKITTAKWPGGMVQTVEQPLCRHKALNSNYSPTKKKKSPVGIISVSVSILSLKLFFLEDLLYQVSSHLFLLAK